MSAYLSKTDIQIKIKVKENLIYDFLLFFILIWYNGYGDYNGLFGL